jgi:hypothetical protein
MGSAISVVRDSDPMTLGRWVPRSKKRARFATVIGLLREKTSSRSESSHWPKKASAIPIGFARVRLPR